MVTIKRLLLTIGPKLGEHQKRQRELEHEIYVTKQTLEQVKLEHTPEEGWAGKNEAERAISRQRHFNTIKDITDGENVVMVKECSLAEIKGIIDDLESKRRALEYVVKDGLIRALGHALYDEDLEPLLNVYASSLGDLMQVEMDQQEVEISPNLQVEEHKAPQKVKTADAETQTPTEFLEKNGVENAKDLSAEEFNKVMGFEAEDPF